MSLLGSGFDVRQDPQDGQGGHATKLVHRKIYTVKRKCGSWAECADWNAPVKHARDKTKKIYPQPAQLHSPAFAELGVKECAVEKLFDG